MMVLMLLVMVVMVTAAALIVLVMMVMLVFLHHFCQLRCQIGLALHGINKLLTRQLVPGSGDHGCLLIVLPQHGNGSIQLLLRNRISPGQDDSRCSLHLVVVELTEVSHIHLDLAGIHHGYGISQGHIVTGDLFHGSGNIG